MSRYIRKTERKVLNQQRTFGVLSMSITHFNKRMCAWTKLHSKSRARSADLFVGRRLAIDIIQDRRGKKGRGSEKSQNVPSSCTAECGLLRDQEWIDVKSNFPGIKTAKPMRSRITQIYHSSHLSCLPPRIRLTTRNHIRASTD